MSGTFASEWAATEKALPELLLLELEPLLEPELKLLELELEAELELDPAPLALDPPLLPEPPSALMEKAQTLVSAQ